MKIGVISDTHNHFEPKLPALLAGVDHILHGGDVGLPWVIMELEDIAPVTAVAGNCDEGSSFKEIEVIELGGHRFLVHHIVDVNQPSDVLRRQISRHRPDVVVFGHSHKPFNQIVGDTLYFNPGYAGKPRFGQPRSVAVLHCDETGVRAEYKAL